MGKEYEHSYLAKRAKSAVGRRAIGSRLPKIIETPKNLLALKGHSSSAICNALLNDIHMLKKPLCKKLHRKNELLPFEAGGETHLENLARLNDCSLFSLVNHTKKRPHNLVLGRMFAHRILDMFEFGITNYVPAAALPALKSAPGSKPLILFNGDDFDLNETTSSMRSLLLDVFRGPDNAAALDLSGVDRVIVFTLQGESKVMFRQYGVVLKKSSESRLPKVELEEAGPKFDMTVRRTHIASGDMMKEATKRPRDPAFVKKQKNVERNEMGDKKGRVHVGRQDLSGLALAKMKGLDRRRDKSADIGEEESGKEDETGIREMDSEEDEEPTSVVPPAKRLKASNGD